MQFSYQLCFVSHKNRYLHPLSLQNVFINDILCNYDSYRQYTRSQFIRLSVFAKTIITYSLKIYNYRRDKLLFVLS